MPNASPPTVKIVRFHQTGGPEVLQLDELPLPEPAAGEVRVRVKAIGLNRADVMFRMGKYLVDPNLPRSSVTKPLELLKPSARMWTGAGSARPSALSPLFWSAPMASTVRSRLSRLTLLRFTPTSSHTRRGPASGCSTSPSTARLFIKAT